MRRLLAGLRPLVFPLLLLAMFEWTARRAVALGSDALAPPTAALEAFAGTLRDGSLWQARLDGSEAKVMAQGIPLAWSLAADDTWLYYIAQGTVTRLEGAIWRMRKHP